MVFQRKAILTAVTLLVMVCPVGNQTVRADGKSKHGSVAVIDVVYILKNSDSFAESKASVNERFSKEAEILMDDRAAIVEKQKLLEDMDASTPGFQHLEDEIERDKLEWNLRANKHRQMLQDVQKEVLSAFYSEIVDAIESYALENEIELVVQNNSETIDRKVSLEAAINRPIMYVKPRRNITDEVTKLLDERAAKSDATEVAAVAD